MSTPPLHQLLQDHLNSIVQPGPAAQGPATSAGATQLDAHLPGPGEQKPNGSPLAWLSQSRQSALSALEGGAQQRQLQDQHGLSDRQRRLPKLDLRVVGGALAVFVLMLGVGSATVLTQQNQDVRQQAYQGTGRVSPAPVSGSPTVVEVPAPEVPEWVPQPAQESYIWLQTAGVPALVALAALGLGFLAVVVGFLFWIFRV